MEMPGYLAATMEMLYLNGRCLENQKTHPKDLAIGVGR
jgi:hypothetical protein